VVKAVWMVSRELGGWAEAGGVKDVVRDQARAFPRIGWRADVVLPLYGYLADRVVQGGFRAWTGNSCHPSRPVPLEAWVLQEGNHTLHFLKSPLTEDKKAPYTYTEADEVRDPRKVRGEGFADGFELNLEFQWAVASYWWSTGVVPGLALGHDGHTAWLPAILKAHPGFGSRFAPTRFTVVIHNAGPGYRQEMGPTVVHDDLIGLPMDERRRAMLDHQYDPLVSASRHARLLTVSDNYAQELLTGRNDHWSGPFGRWLRTSKTPLHGITNGLATDDKDPRDPAAAGIPAGFDPLRGDWAGKARCRQQLKDHLVLHPLALHGRLSRWEGPLYVMQGRLTAQKGVDALHDLLARALREVPDAAFLIMAQGERRYEERMIQLARLHLDEGRYLFVNRFEDSLARLVFAAGDFFLMPSEYEPCGLTDLKAQLMGTLPIVHRVGGLVKVRDGETGFSYEKHRHGGFWGAFLRSLHVYRTDPAKLQALRREAFATAVQDYQWERILEERYLPWLTETGRVPIL